MPPLSYSCGHSGEYLELIWAIFKSDELLAASTLAERSLKLSVGKSVGDLDRGFHAPTDKCYRL